MFTVATVIRFDSEDSLFQFVRIVTPSCIHMLPEKKTKKKTLFS